MTSYQTLINVDELRSLLPEGNLRLVDCRFDLLHPAQGEADYLAGHIPGAVFADLNRDLAGPVTPDSGRHPLPEPALFRDCLARWGIGKETQVVVYDQGSGALAARLWWMLRWVGHPSVAVLNGGMTAWLETGGPVEMQVPETPLTSREIAVQGDLVTPLCDVVDAVAGKIEMTLIDARDARRFAGEVEPIDPVAGHVPGALNLPFTANLQPDGHWKSAQEIRQAWEGLPGVSGGVPVTVMCGSGVTACHLVLSAAIAGIEVPRVFVGSWSEWIRDPARPVAKGP